MKVMLCAATLQERLVIIVVEKPLPLFCSSVGSSFLQELKTGRAKTNAATMMNFVIKETVEFAMFFIFFLFFNIF